MAEITVDISKIIGKIKPMNAVNNGPVRPGKSQTKENFTDFRALRIPLARIHDANLCYAYGGPHCVDIHAIFPDFNADENDPASYDFHLTDEYLSNMRDAGTQVYYRLGASIEHWSKKYGTLPPADFAKWARICEHVIMHYNCGWANGFEWDIQYWEIWNEPDLDPDESLNKRCWGGTKMEFFELYKVSATYLKKRFPNIKIGGPAIAGKVGWGKDFIAAMAKDKVPMDFFSWHRYAVSPDFLGELCHMWRQVLDENGLTETESILNEWNYVRNWNTAWIYSLEQECGLKGAAFIAASMCVCQNAPLDLLMYYDARVSTAMNGIFDTMTLKRRKGFYAFYSFAELVDLGSQTAAVSDDPAVYCVAARNDGGDFGIMVVYYDDDDNALSKEVTINTNLKDTNFECKLVDQYHTFEPVWPQCDAEGRLRLTLQRNSILFITKKNNRIRK